MAETDNPDDLFKLGMFVRIVLDSTATENAPTVPAGAVVEIEGRRAVFVPGGRAGRTFAFRPVKLGREARGPPGHRSRAGQATGRRPPARSSSRAS